MVYRIRVNGRVVKADVSGDTPLLWVLRDSLDLKGTKFGCGAGLCGTCTVHLDGRPVRACQTAVATVGKGAIVTIEAVGETPAGHAVQAA